MTETNTVITYSLAIIGILIALIAPIKISEEQRLIIIATIFFIFMAIILSEVKTKQSKLEEKLKISEQLIDMKSDKRITKKVFKK